MNRILLVGSGIAMGIEVCLGFDQLFQEIVVPKCYLASDLVLTVCKDDDDFAHSVPLVVSCLDSYHFVIL